MMKTRSLLTRGLLLSLMVIYVHLVFAEDHKSIQLPAPELDGGKPLMQVLKERKSSREFSSEKLPLQVLSNLLWEASGVNRPDSGKVMKLRPDQRITLSQTVGYPKK